MAVADAGTNWGKADDPVKNGGNGAQKNVMRQRESHFEKKQDDDRLTEKEGHRAID